MPKVKIIRQSGLVNLAELRKQCLEQCLAAGINCGWKSGVVISLMPIIILRMQ